MTTTPDVSVILPALYPSNDFLRCFQSIKAAFAGQVTYEIICIVKDAINFKELKCADVHFVQEDGPGIYAAMNQGIQKAAGRYIYFVGQDDILLPSAARAVIQGMTCNADIILADVFWGEQRIFRNNPSRNVLIWRNWCHQGVFYDRLKFIDVVLTYPLEFKVQADHYANIVFSGIRGLIVSKYNGCIAWYSSDGFSSRTLDVKFRSAFPKLVLKNFGAISYYIVVARRAMLNMLRLVQK